MKPGNNISRMSPRQKMINLMYLVLLAMLVLNVSTDVLDGFESVSRGVDRSARVVGRSNVPLYERMEAAWRVNPVKAATNRRLALGLRERAAALTEAIDSVKMLIAVEADGEGADPSRLENREDLEAAGVVMLNPVSGAARGLGRRLREFAEYALPLISDSVRRRGAEEALRGLPPFSKQPAIAAVTLLSNLQLDVRLAEGEAMESLLTGIDGLDQRVNELRAFVVPESSVVAEGTEFSAEVVMGAVDTTLRPRIWISGRELEPGTGRVALTALGRGEQTLEGKLEVTRHDGDVTAIPFSTTYTVVAPAATVAPVLMNVLYSGIDNPLDISVSGLDASTVTASMTNGTLRRQGGQWIARPSIARGVCEVAVTALCNGRAVKAGTAKFRVRPLPDPTAYISVPSARGGEMRYKGAPRRVSRRALAESRGLGAELDGDLPDIKFTVTGFSTVSLDAMGNAMPESGEGNRFSARQLQQISRMKSGSGFFITNIRAKGPDGVERILSPIQVAVN